MKASELIERLEQFPPDAEVIISRDEEGNGFGPLYDVGYSYIDEEGHPIHPDDLDDYDTEDVEPSVVLWP